MRGNTRLAALGAAVTAAALALSACGGTEPGGGGKDATAWVLTGGPEATFRSSFETWNKDNSDQKITTEFFANDAYKEKIRTAVGSGSAPTLIFNWAGGSLADYVENGDVVDLTDRTKDLQERLVPSVLESGKVDGKLYAVPNNNAQPVVLFTNKKVLADAGVDTAPATFDELLDAVGKLKRAGVDTPIALAGQSQWPELMWIQYLADRVGGPETFNAVLKGEPDAWSSPEMLKALDMITQLVDAGAFGDKFGSVVADANADAALLHTGKSGMLLQGAWTYANFLIDAPAFADSGDLGFATFPSVEGGKGDPANIVGNPANFWSISAKASKEQQDIAFDYLNTAMYDDAYVDSLIDGGTVPVTVGAEEKIAQSEQAPFLTFAYDMVKNAPNFQLSWDQALPASQAQALLTNLSQLFLGQKTPEQFAKAMNDAS
ncbi:extracellular solute-binding protein [Mumia quercus]|uniref:extracellular solute-binding protein n=1 Tax=Mumia quercus TaxID=2976125 RepID=UPI0021CE0467|nr:extracellular solute-binding protein [Mumia quercus]